MFRVGTLLRFGSIAVWVFHIIACMGGCLGCDNQPKLTSSLDEPVKGQGNEAWRNSKVSLSEEYWWTSSNCDMDNALHSCGSMSSLSTLGQVHDAQGSGSSTKPSEFINHGLILWKESRQKWRANKKPPGWGQQNEPKLSWNATYNNLLTTDKPFSQPVPLGEMIDFLVDIWEQEGMYD